MAQKVIVIPASASSSERNWSSYGFVHNALRNRLKDEKAMKLVYIFTNCKSLSKYDDDEEEDFPVESEAHDNEDDEQ